MTRTRTHRNAFLARLLSGALGCAALLAPGFAAAQDGPYYATNQRFDRHHDHGDRFRDGRDDRGFRYDPGAFGELRRARAEVRDAQIDVSRQSSLVQSTQDDLERANRDLRGSTFALRRARERLISATGTPYQPRAFGVFLQANRDMWTAMAARNQALDAYRSASRDLARAQHRLDRAEARLSELESRRYLAAPVVHPVAQPALPPAPRVVIRPTFPRPFRGHR